VHAFGDAGVNRFWIFDFGFWIPTPVIQNPKSKI